MYVCTVVAMRAIFLCMLTVAMAASGAAQLFGPVDPACSFKYMSGLIQHVHAACGMQTKSCSLSTSCAVVYLPFFQKCHTTLSGMYDISAVDKTHDGTSAVLEQFAKACHAQSAVDLTTCINQLKNSSECNIKLTNVLGLRIDIP